MLFDCTYCSVFLFVASFVCVRVHPGMCHYSPGFSSLNIIVCTCYGICCTVIMNADEEIEKGAHLYIFLLYTHYSALFVTGNAFQIIGLPKHKVYSTYTYCTMHIYIHIMKSITIIVARNQKESVQL